jgi:hypothetical protein
MMKFHGMEICVLYLFVGVQITHLHIAAKVVTYMIYQCFSLNTNPKILASPLQKHKSSTTPFKVNSPTRAYNLEYPQVQHP